MPPLPDGLFPLKILLGQVEDTVLRRLLLLASIGESGPHAFFLSEEFRSLGVLHLLVLSGTQVQRLAASLRWLLLALSRSWGHAREVAVAALEGAALIVFASAVGWSPPLARATLMELLSLAFPRFRRDGIFLASLALHVALFPEHVGGLSFHLSWFASLALGVAGGLGLRGPWRVVFVSCLAQVCVVGMKGAAGGTATGLPWLIATNVALGWIFDVWLMPALGATTVFSLVTSPWPHLGERVAASAIARVTVAHPLAGMARVVLVAIRAFRYIGKA